MEKDKLKNVSLRIPDSTRREFLKKLIDDPRYTSIQDFLLQAVERYLKEGKGNGKIHDNS